MASSRQQFDSLLGGQSHLPSGLNILHIISARAQEIEALTEAIDDPQRSGLVFQRLPKHMRRRIMSHNVKRMPRRLREAHLRQMEKSGLPPKSKRPSRKYRRRPSNLLQEYNRRQQKFIWLETHIWHAKRFHMIDKWGYKLPNFPNDKSFRACYRASANHCLLQDISYYCCIELRGPLDEIIDGLKQHTDKACGLTFAAKVYISGSREGNITVFRKNSYPYGAIGNISFLWRPSKIVSSEGKEAVISEKPEERTLWLWIHPAFYEEFCNELIDTFNFVQSDMDITETVPFVCGGSVSNAETTHSSVKHKRKGQEKKVEIEKIASKTVFYNRTCKFESSSGHVKMTLLKDTLNRFRLTGPLSHSILQDALHVVSSITSSNTRVPSVTKNLENLGVGISTSKMNIGSVQVESSEDQDEKTKHISCYDETMEVDESTKDDNELERSANCDCRWWHDVCSDTYSLECVKLQKKLWETMKGATSPAQLPPHSVLALVVTDPRRYLPEKRMKCSDSDDPLRTPLHYFTTYFTDEFFRIAEEHTNQYTVWKHGKSIKTDAKELKKFIAVNLIMGCIKFPRLRLYWSTEYGYTPISTIMSRDRFLALRNAFHVVDASSAPDDNNNTLWKVQQVIDAVRNVCLSLPRDHVTYSVDEQMIPFTGRCPLRQFVKNKPRPVGLKNFVLTTSAGLVLDFEIYQGDSTPLQTKEFGLGPSVILRLAHTLPQESFIYFDRYFTSLPLLEKLTEMKLYGSGTIMANRIKGFPLTDASKMVRGQSIELVAENCDLVVVEWKDSNKVIMASNCFVSTPTEPVQRWSKIDNKHIEVDCPSVVRKYNQNMGGVDVCDQQMECYRAWFRSRKWTWKVILHFVDLAVVNAWNQYMRSIKGNNIPRKKQKDLLHFKLEVAEGLLAVPSVERKVISDSESEQVGDELPAAKRSKFFNPPAKLPCSDKRYDGYEHFPSSDDIAAPHTCRYEHAKVAAKCGAESVMYTCACRRTRHVLKTFTFVPNRNKEEKFPLKTATKRVLYIFIWFYKHNKSCVL